MVLGRVSPQPLIAIVTLGLAVLLNAAGWATGGGGATSATDLWLAVALVATAALAYRFPVYVRHGTKLHAFTVPIYLLAVLLPWPLAATAGGLAIALGELAVRAQYGNLPSDIATTTGRWMVLIAAASALGRFAALPPLSGLLGAALLLWVGDLLTIPLVVGPMTGDPPRAIILSALRQAGLSEAAQYVVGVVGAVAARPAPWTLALLIVPVVLIYLMSRREADDDNFDLLANLIDAAEARDPFRVEHSRRVCAIADGIVRQLGISGQEATVIRMAARIHDLEREIAVEDNPLAGPLMQRFADVVAMARDCTERWDGSGRPLGLSGTAIPFGARVIAVADAFDTLVSGDVDRPTMTPHEAMTYLRAGASHEWDPAVVEALAGSLQDGTTVGQTPSAAAGSGTPRR